jgi:spore maturation protein SpmA
LLNYIWLSLIVLGIGSALFIDLSDISSGRYKNNQPVDARLEFDRFSELVNTSDIKCNLFISAANYNEHFGDSAKADLVLTSLLVTTENKNEKRIIINVNDSSPEILKSIAMSSGEANELIADIHIMQNPDSINVAAKLTFEPVSFIMMKRVTNDVIDIAKTAVAIALGLIGIMALWLGVMKVAEDAGLIAKLANMIKPLTKKLFPDVPSDHPAIGAMLMNISANMLGLGNAATPFGLKAMDELDKLNPEKGTATNAMVTFLAINTAGLTLIPATAIAVRAAQGSSDPTIIIGTSIFGASCATITGIIASKLFEKFPIKKGEFGNWIKQYWKLPAALLTIILFFLIGSVTGLLNTLTSLLSFVKPDILKDVIQILSTIAIPFFILLFIGYGAIKKVKIYEQFVEGAKEGFNIAVKIIPYLVAMLAAIAIFRAGGALDNILIPVMRVFTDMIGMPPEALPMALIRPLSGSGSLGVMAETMSAHGPDSYIGVLVSTFFGSTETTFYVLAVYFGAVSIRKTRHAVAVGLLADAAGILGALFIVNLMFS